MPSRLAGVVVMGRSGSPRYRSVGAVDGNFIRSAMRDLLFAALEEYVAPAMFEARNDWPTGAVGWFEAVRLGLR
jgi:hypothetical protein